MKKFLLPPILPMLGVLLYVAVLEFIEAQYPEVLSSDVGDEKFPLLVFLPMFVLIAFPPLMIANILDRLLRQALPVRCGWLSILAVGGALGFGLCYVWANIYSGPASYTVCITLCVAATAAMSWWRNRIVGVGVQNLPNKS